MGISRQAVAQRMIERTVTDLDAEKLKAENSRLEAQIEHEKLLVARQGGAEKDGWRDFILGQLDKVSGQLNETQRALSDSQANAMQDRINILSSEIERLSNTHVEQSQATPVSAISSMRQALEDARALLEIVEPHQTPPPVVRAEAPEVRAWETRAKLDHEIRMIQLQAEEHRRDQESAAKVELEKERLSIERQKAEQTQRFISETAPKILEAGKTIIDMIITNQAQAAAAPAVAAQTAPQVPPGLPSFQCQQCGQVVFYRPEFQQVGCLSCGAVYGLGTGNVAEQNVPEPEVPGMPSQEQPPPPPRIPMPAKLEIH